MRSDGNAPHNPRRLRPRQIDREQTILQVRAEYLHPVGQHEHALELAGGDAAVDELPALVVGLATANDELAFLNAHFELVEGKTGNGERDAQAIRVAVVTRQTLDIVRGYPSAALVTRSSTRSISSNPKRKGLDNEGIRDISKPFQATLTGPRSGTPITIPADPPAWSPEYGCSRLWFKNGLASGSLTALLVGFFELPEDLVATADGVVQGGLGGLPAEQDRLQLLLDDVADHHIRAEPEALGMVGGRVEGHLFDRDVGSRIAVIEANAAALFISGARDRQVAGPLVPGRLHLGP